MDIGPVTSVELLIYAFSLQYLALWRSVDEGGQGHTVKHSLLPTLSQCLQPVQLPAPVASAIRAECKPPRPPPPLEVEGSIWLNS